MPKKESGYDQNIIAALQRIKTPIIGIDGKKFIFREKARNETGFEHIAKKVHRLKVRDIETLETILKNPIFIENDKANKSCINYYGKRKGKETKGFLKIVTSNNNQKLKTFLIITVYPVKSINEP